MTPRDMLTVDVLGIRAMHFAVVVGRLSGSGELSFAEHPFDRFADRNHRRKTWSGTVAGTDWTSSSLCHSATLTYEIPARFPVSRRDATPDAPYVGTLRGISLAKQHGQVPRARAREGDLTTTGQTFVIVGASLAGAKTAEALRNAGFDDGIVLLGEESQRPYERAPLSKDHLMGRSAKEKIQVYPQQWYSEH